jgi:hypothetical protein
MMKKRINKGMKRQKGGSHCYLCQQESTMQGGQRGGETDLGGPPAPRVNVFQSDAQPSPDRPYAAQTYNAITDQYNTLKIDESLPMQ